MKENKTIILINHYASSPDTGMGGRTFYMARALHKLGHNVTLITASFNHKLHSPKEFLGPYDIDVSHGFRLIRIKVSSYPNSYSKRRILNWFIFGYRLVKFFSEFIDKAQVVLCSSPSLLAYIPSEIIAKNKSAKLIFEVRDIWPLTLTDIGGYSKRHIFIQFLQWVEKRAYRNSDIVLSNLPAAHEHMAKHGMELEKFHWIPNGFDHDELENAENLDTNVVNQLPKEKFVVGYTGAIGEANALKYLIEAAGLLKEEKDIFFVVVGTGREKQALIERSKDLQNICFINPIPKKQIQSMLAKFDACYLGWKNESIYQYGIATNKLPDYLFSSKPIIHSYSGASDIIEIEKCGISVPAEDPVAISEAIKRMKNMPEEARKKMGEMGYRYVKNNHDYINLARRLVATFENEV